MSGSVENAIRFPADLSKLREKKGCLIAMNNVALTLATEISDLKTKTSSIVGFLQG